MTLKKIIPYILIILLGSSGCTFLENLDQLNEMGEYSREKDNQHRLVQSIDDHYDLLTKIIAQGKINQYKDRDSWQHSFGDPILIKKLSDGSERWLYRYAIYRLAHDKVYLYFDRNSKLVKWEKLPCQKFF